MIDQRVILVMGIEGSGTSCVAQVLHELGIDMGNLNIRFEDRGILEVYKAEQTMESWVKNRISENKIIWGVKFPIFHQILLRVIEGIKKLDIEDIRLIVVKRHRDCIIQSNYEKRRYANSSIFDYYKHVEQSVDKGIHERDAKARDANIPILNVDYDMLIDESQRIIRAIIVFCFAGIDKHPSIESIFKAINSVDKTRRHWVLA